MMKVESCDGDVVGLVYVFMVYKGIGCVIYVVFSFGGFFGMGKSFYLLLFVLLQFDLVCDLYVVMIDKCVFEGGLSWLNNVLVFDQVYVDCVVSYYGLSSEDVIYD